MRLLIAGVIQDRKYYDEIIAPRVDGDHVRYLGSVDPARRALFLQALMPFCT